MTFILTQGCLSSNAEMQSVDMALNVDVFIDGRHQYCHSIKHEYSLFDKPDVCEHGIDDGTLAAYMTTKAVVNKDGICTLWRTLEDNRTRQVDSDTAIVVQFDLNNAGVSKFRGDFMTLTGPDKPDYPGGQKDAPPMQDQESVVRPELWCRQAGFLLSSSVGVHKREYPHQWIQADDNYVVISTFGNFVVGEI